MDDYEKYESKCKKIRKANKALLNEFEIYEDAIEAKDGAHAISMFLGYWFIKKAMWASQSSIKSNATSLKKFYTFMHEKCLIGEEALIDLKETIKNDMPEWLATLKRYDAPSVDDVWQY
jgi:hypothetical protein